MNFKRSVVPDITKNTTNLLFHTGELVFSQVDDTGIFAESASAYNGATALHAQESFNQASMSKKRSKRPTKLCAGGMLALNYIQ